MPDRRYDGFPRPANGRRADVLELQLATDAGLPVERDDEIVNELAEVGVVAHEASPHGYLVRLNPSSALLIALGVTPPAHRAGSSLAEGRRMPGDLNIAYL